MTSQINLDSYIDAGVATALALVNTLVIHQAFGRATTDRDPMADIADAVSIDPPSVDALSESHLPVFVALAEDLHRIVVALDQGDTDSAARHLNALLVEHPAYPHLAKEQGRWRLHHHPADAELVSMWTSICAEALARVLGRGDEARIGICTAPMCDRAFYDTSRNGSRRFCSTTCQSRVKTAAFRKRSGAGGKG